MNYNKYFDKFKERYKDQILTEIPEVDLVVGIGANSDIVALINKALEGEKTSKRGPSPF